MEAALSWLSAPCVMGVLNVTPDSFYDGGVHDDPEAAWSRLAEVAEQGAAICDVGAESTRPGASPVAAERQIERLAPLLSRAAERGLPLPLSIDTTSARVAEVALEAGASFVNDTSAGADDARLLPLVAERGAGVCLMHRRGTPATMQRDPVYADVVSDVRDALARRAEAAVAAGVAESAIVLDPGIGFGKTLQHNLALLGGLADLRALGFPVMVGVSRKSMFDRLLGRAVTDRLAASLGAGLAAVAVGADVLRVHDVRETVDALGAWVAVAEAA
ncbi:MAG: dihydropteroate synthase [Miltoncostaeaceae bacterium]